MALKRYRFAVYLAGDDVDGDGQAVEVTHSDLMRAELEGPRHGFTGQGDQPINYATLWIWCAMSRTHETDMKFRDWSRDVLIGFDRIAEEDVPPTTPDPSGSL